MKPKRPPWVLTKSAGLETVTFPDSSRGARRQRKSGRRGPYRQASPPPARHRPGARSARLGDVGGIVSRSAPECESPISFRSILSLRRPSPATFAAMDLPVAVPPVRLDCGRPLARQQAQPNCQKEMSQRVLAARQASLAPHHERFVVSKSTRPRSEHLTIFIPAPIVLPLTRLTRLI